MAAVRSPGLIHATVPFPWRAGGPGAKKLHCSAQKAPAPMAASKRIKMRRRRISAISGWHSNNRFRLYRGAYCTAVKISEAFVPPKPKEFDSAALTSRVFALCGTRSISVSTDGLSRFRVGGTI